MKAFFILLLLTNIIFAMVQWLLPYERLMLKSRPPVATDRLRLLDESDVSFEQQVAEQQVTEVHKEVETSPGIAATPDRLCYTLGPFKEQQNLKEVALKFKQNNIPVSSRSSQEREYRGMMVYVDGHSSRADAVATADSLSAKGVRDYIIVNEPGRNHILSLGVFSLKKNAERRLNRIAKLGYPVKSEARYRNRTIYWLDYSESENENLTRFIESLKKEKGISRIARNCSEKAE